MSSIKDACVFICGTAAVFLLFSASARARALRDDSIVDDGEDAVDAETLSLAQLDASIHDEVESHGGAEMPPTSTFPQEALRANKLTLAKMPPGLLALSRGLTVGAAPMPYMIDYQCTLPSSIVFVYWDVENSQLAGGVSFRRQVRMLRHVLRKNELIDETDEMRVVAALNPFHKQISEDSAKIGLPDAVADPETKRLFREAWTAKVELLAAPAVFSGADYMLADRIRADMRVVRLMGGTTPFEKMKAVVIISNDGMFADEFAGLRRLVGPRSIDAPNRTPWLVHMCHSPSVHTSLRDSTAIDVRLEFEGVKILARTNRPTNETWCGAAKAWLGAVKKSLKTTPNVAVRIEELKGRFPKPAGVTATLETVLQGLEDDACFEITETTISYFPGAPDELSLPLPPQSPHAVWVDNVVAYLRAHPGPVRFSVLGTVPGCSKPHGVSSFKVALSRDHRYKFIMDGFFLQEASPAPARGVIQWVDLALQHLKSGPCLLSDLALLDGERHADFKATLRSLENEHKFEFVEVNAGRTWVVLLPDLLDPAVQEWLSRVVDGFRRASNQAASAREIVIRSAPPRVWTATTRLHAHAGAQDAAHLEGLERMTICIKVAMFFLASQRNFRWGAGNLISLVDCRNSNDCTKAGCYFFHGRDSPQQRRSWSEHLFGAQAALQQPRAPLSLEDLEASLSTRAV